MYRHMDISSQGLFGMGTFWHKELSGPWIFRLLNVLAHGYFSTLQSNMDIWAQTFGHLCYCGEISLCRKVLVPKRPWRRNVHVPKHVQGRNVHVSKCPGDEMSVWKCLCPKCLVPKWWEAELKL